MVDTVFYGFHDYDGEPSSTSINVAEITGDVAALTTAIANLRTAINGIILGGADKSGFTDITFDTPVPITDPFAQRETKWQVVVVEATTGRKYAANLIPMANLALLENNSPYIVKAGSVVVVTGAAAVNAFITAFEALALSQAGLALSVWDIYHVGANI
jgi:hypothetical protein